MNNKIKGHRLTDNQANEMLMREIDNSFINISIPLPKIKEGGVEMKTIVQGNLEMLKKYKYFECKNCGWIGKAEEKEYKYCDDQREGDRWSSYCPLCKRLMYSIEDRHKLEQIMLIESKQMSQDYWRNR